MGGSTLKELALAEPVRSIESSIQRLMKITNVGSACFVVEIGGIRLLTDPWITGLGFINGWAPLIEAHNLEIFKSVDYVWFSHEHPDHFHPASLRKLSELWASFPKVLFQSTLNGRVATYLREKYGASVLEIPSNSTLALPEGPIVRIQDAGIYDSFLQIKSGGYCFTHLNDCCVCSRSEFSAIRAFAGSHIHVVTSQYGLANGPTGKDDFAAIERAAQEKLNYFISQVEGISPDYAIPSSSAIHFCCPDNLWMNKHRISPALPVETAKRKGIAVHMLLPSPYKTYDFESPPSLVNSSEDERFFHNKLAETNSKILNKLESSVDSEQIEEAVRECGALLRKNNNPIIVSAMRRYAGLLQPLTFYVTDLDKHLRIDPWKGLVTHLQPQPPNADVVCIHSYVLQQLYASPYGIDALNASARFDLKATVTLSTLNNHLNVVTVNTAGIYFKITALLRPIVLRKLLRIFIQWYQDRTSEKFLKHRFCQLHDITS